MSEAKDKLLAVQECYISVCREKDMLEEQIHNRAEEEDLIKEKEVEKSIFTVDKCANRINKLFRESVTCYLFLDITYDSY